MVTNKTDIKLPKKMIWNPLQRICKEILDSYPNNIDALLDDQIQCFWKRQCVQKHLSYYTLGYMK